MLCGRRSAHKITKPPSKAQTTPRAVPNSWADKLTPPKPPKPPRPKLPPLLPLYPQARTRDLPFMNFDKKTKPA